jgi:hypothetical protein
MPPAYGIAPGPVREKQSRRIKAGIPKAYQGGAQSFSRPGSSTPAYAG